MIFLLKINGLLIMDIIGKIILENKKIEQVSKDFNVVEAGLEKNNLDNIEKALNMLRNSGLSIYAVHTPHITVDEIEYFKKAETVAKEFNALLVFHSNKLPITYYLKIIDILTYDKVSIETNPGISINAIENFILKKGKKFCLDIAHLYISSDTNFYSDLKYLVDKYKNQINHIHISDSTKFEDNLPVGEGEIDFKKVMNIIRICNCKAVIEVMSKYQKDGRDKILNYMK